MPNSKKIEQDRQNVEQSSQNRIPPCSVKNLINCNRSSSPRLRNFSVYTTMLLTKKEKQNGAVHYVLQTQW